MTQEELLKPRYKVIADYPNSVFKIGLILYKQNLSDWYFDEKKLNGLPSVQIENLPHLFRKLEWWEEKDEKDMPQYLKLSPEHKDDYCISLKEIFKVYKWRHGFAQIDEDNEYDTLDNREFDFIPATEQEYLNYIKRYENRTRRNLL